VSLSSRSLEGAGQVSALVPAPQARRSAPGGEAFWRRVGALEERHASLWLDTDDSPPLLGDLVSRSRQRENARTAERLLDDVAGRCERYPEAEDERAVWRAEVREVVRAFGEERLGWPEGYRRLVFDEAFHDTTARFVREARAFDPGVKIEDVGQALRNVWIMNSLQLLFDLEVGFSPAIFGYSMLYPCTDNLLDDPSVRPEEKAAFNEALGLRLRGRPALPRTRREQQAFSLVGRIETQYPRREYPDLFRSLRAIHRAQERSLDQHRPDADRDEAWLLGTSVAKGGASLLADGYLVAGHPTPEEEDACFGYGVFLQLLDDLQDCGTDREAGHATLFTRAAARGSLDRPTGRLYRFMHRVLDGSPRLRGTALADRRDLVLRNCTMLLVAAVGDQRGRFSEAFVRAVEERWPLDFDSMARLRHLARRRYRQVSALLSRTRHVESPLDLL